MTIAHLIGMLAGWFAAAASWWTGSSFEAALAAYVFAGILGTAVGATLGQLHSSGDPTDR